MRIVLTMVGIALGLGIAVVAGVYGWQEYESARPTVAPVSTTSTIVEEKKTEPSTPKPVEISTPKPVSTTQPAPIPAPSTSIPTPATSAPAIPSATKPVAPVASTPQAPKPAPTAPSLMPTTGAPPATQPVPGEDKPIAEPETPTVATAEKLAQLMVGMTEDNVVQAMGAEGVMTPDESLPKYTPDGWYEVRWPNPDGSYIAGLFSDRGTLANITPFNMPGAETWKATPWYAVPHWLNDKLEGNSMPVRVPAVDVVEAQAGVYQFRGPLANAEGQVLGSISGSYYLQDPSGRFTRAVEGSYEYALANGAVDANTFQFTE